MGLSQTLTLLASYKFAYFVAPRSAQSLFMSFHFCSVTIAGYVGVAYNLLLKQIFTTLEFPVSG